MSEKYIKEKIEEIDDWEVHIACGQTKCKNNNIVKGLHVCISRPILNLKSDRTYECLDLKER